MGTASSPLIVHATFILLLQGSLAPRPPQVGFSRLPFSWTFLLFVISTVIWKASMKHMAPPASAARIPWPDVINSVLTVHLINGSHGAVAQRDTK